MKKFFLTMFMIFAVSSTCLAATVVRVSDYNLDEFFRAYNNVALNVNKNNRAFDEFPIKAMQSDIYDTYLATCGTDGHGVAVGLFANKQGQISKITLSLNGNDKIAGKCSGDVFLNMLVTLGMTKPEWTALLNDMKSGKTPAYHLCAATNRIIVVEVSGDRAAGVINIRITAAVN